MDKLVQMWVVFDRPKQHPENYVAIKFLNCSSTNDFIVSAALEKVERTLAHKGLVRVRFKNENPEVIQIWMEVV